MAPWAVCCRTLEQHQEMHFPQSGVMHFSFAEDLHLCILLPPSWRAQPPLPPPCTTRERGEGKVGILGVVALWGDCMGISADQGF